MATSWQNAMFAMCILAVTQSTFYNYTLSNWTKSTQRLSTNVKITAYNPTNNELLIFGGDLPNSTFLLSYHLDADQLHQIQLQSSIITSDASNFGSQSYTQYNNSIYFVDNYRLHVLHMNGNKSNASYASDVILPVYGLRTCVRISHDDRFVFIIGGCSSSDGGTEGKRKQFTIYDIINDLWTDGPNMTEIRSTLTCAVVNDYLYAIGGDAGRFGRSHTIERIYVRNMNNITSQTWHILAVGLHEPISGAFSASANHILYILGGGTDIGSTQSVERLDTNTMSISSDKPLLIPLTRSYAEVINGKIYIVRHQQIFWASILTTNPTTYPTIAPTEQPTQRPYFRMIAPAEHPTEKPTQHPSDTSTTEQPTKYPTVYPSLVPYVATVDSIFSSSTGIHFDTTYYQEPTNDTIVKYEETILMIMLIALPICVIAVAITAFYYLREIKRDKHREIIQAKEIGCEDICNKTDELNLGKKQAKDEQDKEGDEITIEGDAHVDSVVNNSNNKGSIALCSNNVTRGDNIAADEFVVKGNESDDEMVTTKGTPFKI